MKKLFCLFCFIFLSYSIQPKTTNQYFNFTDPVPGAKYVNPEATIIINPNETVDKLSLLNPGAFKISGSLSGNCSFTVIQSSDNKTIILKPVNKFKLGEHITVEYTERIKTKSGASIKPFSYEFYIKEKQVKVNKNFSIYSELSDEELANLPYGYYNYDMISRIPDLTVSINNNPSPGRIFLGNFALSPIIPYNYCMLIANNDGSFFYYKTRATIDLNIQPNGNITFFESDLGKYYELDYYYDIVDSFFCGNGYLTDLHELILLPNRNALLMSYDSQYVDMSQIVPGGNPNAIVSGLIIQEIDADKNVVFQWRSWDHFLITDAWHENLLAASIDYVHGNAIEKDYDGHLLISSRHLDEITKINRTTGDIIWRLGGKNNQFTFTNDTSKFNYQHDIRRLPNGNITLYDNGNWHLPPHSRAVEYRLDEINKTCTMVWEYRNTPEVFAPATGNAQRLPNGNTLIGWGLFFTPQPTLTEVKPDGTKALEMTFPFGVYTYRARKFDYKPNENKALFPPEAVFLGQNYPNPFNPKTTITYGLPRVFGTKGTMDVTLKVYDVLGREIATLVDAPMKPYTYNVDFDANGLATGIYFYTLRVTGNGAQYYETKKMIVIK